MKQPFRSAVFALASIVVAGVASVAQAGMQYRLESDVTRELTPVTRIGTKVQLTNVPLIEGKRRTLDIERFSVYSPDAVLDANDGNGHVTRTAPPATAYFRGAVQGDDESAVFIAVDQEIHGFILTKGRRFRLAGLPRGERTNRRDRDEGVYLDEVTLDDEIAAGVNPTFECAVDKHDEIKKKAYNAVSEALRFHPAPQSLLTGTATYTIRLAVSTDGELVTNLGSLANAQTYVANIVGAMSTIYSRDLRTDIQLAYQENFTNSATDPFTEAVGALDVALSNLQTHWTSSPPAAPAHSAVMLFSGKYTPGGGSGGYAYIDELGTTNEYGILQGLGRTDVTLSATPPNAVNPNGNPNYQAATSVFDFAYWAVAGTAHELGHIVESLHTHCISWSNGTDGVKYGVSSTRGFVDECYSGEGAGCYTNGSGGAVTANLPPELGTIMSYCHLISDVTVGYGKATRFTFGKSTETSAKILDLMTTRLNAIEPTSPTISVAATVGQNTSGNTASITSPSGTSTYLWTISGGTFSGGGTTATGTSVLFAVTTTTPVRLTVTGVVNSTGLASTDYKNVTVGGTPTPPAVSFTDDPLVAGTTTIKALHLTQLQTAIDSWCTVAGCTVGGWTAISSGTVIQAAHITQLRTHLASALPFFGRTVTYSHTSLSAGMTITAADIQEIRNAMK